MKIFFLGHQNWACLSLDALVQAGHDIVGVAAEQKSFDKKYTWSTDYDSVAQHALNHKLPLYQPEDINSAEFLAILDNCQPDLLVCVSYHQIIGEEILKQFSAINAHGSLLPKYRGRAPINWAIINGETKVGVTVHYIVREIDAGDIILQDSVSVGPDETAGDIYHKTLPLYPQLVLEAVNLIEAGTAPRIAQDPEKASCFAKRSPEDGLIDWRKNALDIHNWIRALSHPYPGSFTYNNEKRISVWRSSLSLPQKTYTGVLGEIVDSTDKGSIVMTGDGAIFLYDIIMDVGTVFT